MELIFGLVFLGAVGLIWIVGHVVGWELVDRAQAKYGFRPKHWYLDFLWNRFAVIIVLVPLLLVLWFITNTLGI